jgi:hypothetical protein
MPATQIITIDPTGNTVDFDTIFTTLDEAFPTVSAYISSLIPVDVLILPGGNAIAADVEYSEGTSTVPLRIIFTNPPPMGYRRMTAAERAVYTYLEGGPNGELYTLSLSHRNIAIIGWYAGAGADDQTKGGVDLEIIADNSFGQKTANLAITNFANYSGTCFFKSIGRAGNASSMIATLTNFVQTDGPAIFDLNAAAGNASLDLTLLHSSFLADSGGGLRWNITRGTGAYTLIRELKNSYFGQNGYAYNWSGAGTGTITNRACLNNVYENFSSDIENVPGSTTDFAGDLGSASNRWIENAEADSTCVRNGAGIPAEDVRLLENSPLRRTGIDAGVARDYRGVRRTVFDIGAFQYTQILGRTGTRPFGGRRSAMAMAMATN